MAIIKCKMCGGELNIIEGASTAECEFCGVVQTIPNLDDEKKLIQFERAERLRKQCEFDKAAGIYETIVADFRQEAEAYWGLVLCKYGIEYVDDPATGKKIPTCHRSSFDSIMEDSDFEQVLENADTMARRVYREEAKQIEEIRKGILSVSNNEPPYDIFICYKETDEKGDRTLDSVLAQDVYEALADKGYRVFFSRISLEDKLGVEYEPYIFAALNSAKIMLAFGTDYEYFNAVWVKNEWSRFLKLMAKDKNKHLIPCFKGIDAYDMPKEFARLQAQDLGKVGAIQDLLRGIEKLMPHNPPAVSSASAGAVVDSVGIEDLIRKTQIHLESKNWKNVQDTCNRITALDPENPWAYIYQIARVRRVTNLEDLGNCVQELSNSTYYSKALQFADPALAEKLKAWNASSQENARKAEQKCEPGRKNAEKVRGLLAGGANHTVAVLIDGTVISCGDNQYGQCETDLWRDIVAVACGRNHTVGLRSDGTVLACGDDEKGQCQVRDWKNVIAIASDEDHTVGLCADGTVVSCGSTANGKRNVSDWTDIQAITCGYHHTLGRKKDGTFVATGSNRFGQCKAETWTESFYIMANNVQTLGLRKNGTVVGCGCDEDDRLDVRLWRDIVDISMGTHHSIGLKADGTVVACGYDNNHRCTDTRHWTNVVGLAKSFWHTLAIRADGTVLACGDQDNGKCEVSGWRLFQSIDTLEEERQEARQQRKALDEQLQKIRERQQQRKRNITAAVAAGEGHVLLLQYNGTVVARGNNNHHQCDVKGWDHIKAVACGEHFSLGLKADGTVVACGNNEKGQCNVSGWRNIVAIACGYDHSVGLRSDGTVVACGDNELGPCNVEDWTDVTAVSCGYYHTVGLRKDGTVLVCGHNRYGQSNVGSWKNIVAVAANNVHTIGLKANGTVVACGDNEKGQCDVTQWKDIISIDCGSHHSVGLRSDGTVVACGSDASQRSSGTKGWREIAGIVCGLWCTIGIPEKEGIRLCGELSDVNLAGMRPFGHIDTVEQDRELFEKNMALLPRLCRNWGTQISTHTGYMLDEYGDLVLFDTSYRLLNGSERMRDLIAITGTSDFVAGLRKDGTVAYASNGPHGYNAVECWEDILQLRGGMNCVFGIRQDGTVVSSGYNADTQYNVSAWRNIVAVACGYQHAVGLRRDGTAVGCGSNDFGQCNTQNWSQLAQVICGSFCTLGLQKDGSVLMCGTINSTVNTIIPRWKNITQLSVGSNHAVGLCKDGTVLACGDNEKGQCEVRSWRNIVAVACGADFTVGLTSYGTLVACGYGNGFVAKLDKNKPAKAIYSEGYNVYILYADGRICFSHVGTEDCIHTGKIYSSLSFLEERKRVVIPTDPAQRQQIQNRILQKRQAWRNAGRCQRCGGEIKGLFTKKCGYCGKTKDY